MLEKVVSELNAMLCPAVVSKIHQPGEKTLIFKVFKKGKSENLLISVHPEFPRIHLTAERFENPPSPLRFCAFLRSRLAGARIQDISQEEGERVVRIGFKGSRGEPYTLAIELTGRSGNVILTDGSGVVCDALRYFPEGCARVVTPGAKLLPLPLPEAIRGKEEEILPEEGETWNRAAERYYLSLIREHAYEAEKRLLHHAIKNAVDRVKRKLKNLVSDREKASLNLFSSRFGELLLANFNKVKRGMSGVEVEDLYRTPPAAITIPLDPRLTTQENAERFFKKTRKAKRALELLKGRIPEVQVEVEYINGLVYEFENIETREDAAILREELSDAGYLKAVSKEKKKKVEAPQIRRFTIAKGLRVLCGKSARGNDLIVREYSRPEDLWFHAKGVAGAHVLLKGGGRKIPQEAIEEAAAVAAYFSKARGSAKAEVVYTEAKNVKKPKGARPGMVVVKEYRTVFVRPKEPAGEKAQ